MTRAAALFLAIFTGFTGLVYQVTWQKYLATLLGSHSEATAAVLGIFLGGLSVGYWLFGIATTRLIHRATSRNRYPRLLLVYGGIELGIGIYALVFPWLFRGALSLSYALPHDPPAIGFASDVILAALLIGPPTVLMGATIPVLTQALSRSIEDATRFHAFVYGLNTLGAFVGALAAGFYVVPRFGLDGTLSRMGIINLCAGAGYAILGMPRRDAAAISATRVDADPKISGAAFYLLVSLLIGFSMMTLETTLIRLAGLSFGTSQFTFSMVVAAFVLCIAIGGLSVSGLTRIPKSVLVFDLWALVIVLLGLYFLLPQAPYWVFLLRMTLENTNPAFYVYHFAGFALLLAVIGLPVFLSGLSLPLLFHHLRSEYGELGSLAGRLYSWNTVGSLLGALIGGYALFFWFDLHHVYRVAVAALIIAATIATVRILRVRTLVAAGALPILLFLAVQPPWYETLLTFGLYRRQFDDPDIYNGYRYFVERHVAPIDRNLHFYDDGPNTTVAVVSSNEAGGRSSLSLVVNGKADGNTKWDYVTMSLLGVLPAIMADEHKRAFVIGWGTGVTAGVLATIDGVEEVVTAEISRAVIESAPHFDSYNENASRNPKIQLIQGDAFRTLTRSERKFDVIVSEPSNPWVAGVEMLYSKEFLELARTRLSPGGVYAQWFHRYETDDESLDLILRTYSSVFDYVSIWGAAPFDLIILGFSEEGPASDFYRLLERAGKPPYQKLLSRMGIERPSELLIRELVPIGPIQAVKRPGRLHTLYRPLLADIAGRAFFRRGEAELPFTGFGEPARVGRKNSMWRRYVDFVGGRLPDEERLDVITKALGQGRPYAISMVAKWMTESPDSAESEIAHRRAVDWLRSHDEGSKDPERLFEDVQALYELEFPQKARIQEQHWSPMDAWRLSEAYTKYYFHGAPFSDRKLRKVWSRCRSQIRTEQSCNELAAAAAMGQSDVLFDAKASRERFVRECLSDAPRDGACDYGQKQAGQILMGDLSGLETRLKNLRSSWK